MRQVAKYIVFGAMLVLANGARAEEPKKKPTVFVGEVPKAAKEVRPDVYRLEENGKQIIYIRTPFGVTRMEQSAEMQKLIEAGPPMGINAKEEGEYYKFERMTPFGRAAWKKKKDSQEKLDLLTKEEMDALEYTRRLQKTVPGTN